MYLSRRRGVNGGDGGTPLGHGENKMCGWPKLIQLLLGVKMDAIVAGDNHSVALADDGNVYAWGCEWAAERVALG
jgi:alpha-tubulin suppressor-like RCC1 family protein